MRRFMALIFCAALLSAASIVEGQANTPWVLIARKAAGRVKEIRETQQKGPDGYDFASVILDAPAGPVFDTALRLLRANRSLSLLMLDPRERSLQFAQGERTATLRVVDLGPDISQLLIAGRAGSGQSGTSTEIVSVVMRVCAELGKECQPD